LRFLDGSLALVVKRRDWLGLKPWARSLLSGRCLLSFVYFPPLVFFGAANGGPAVPRDAVELYNQNTF
jgi:hypothetical protein